MMTKNIKLMSLSNPERFMQLVAIDDAKSRFDGFENYDDVILCEIVRYGVFNDEAMIADLMKLYDEVMMMLPEERRFEIFKRTSGLVKTVPSVSANAFLPFIAEDTSRRIVSTAVIDLVSFAPIENNDPMSRPKAVIGMIESGAINNDGAAFGALLNLGDQRLCKLLWPLRESLEPAAIIEAINCETGFIYSATVDFYIDWLESMDGDRSDGLFGTVAAGLGLLKKSSSLDCVVTGIRPFPTHSVRSDQWKAMAKPVPLADYITKIAPRLYALERSEPPLRIMPHVLIEWGLEPVTDPSEMEILDDRVWQPQPR